MVIPNLLIILGPPGSGKGTQGKMLAPILNYNYVSMGQVLRNYSAKGTELGLKIKTMVDSGHIIPDEWINVIFHEVMMAQPADTEGIILDGFPRDLDQAPILEQGMIDFNIQEVNVIFIDVPEDKLIARLTKRGQGGEMRSDDNPEIFHTRFEQYRTRTYPLREYFLKKGNLIDVSGDAPVEDVHKEIVKKLGL